MQIRVAVADSSLHLEPFAHQGRGFRRALEPDPTPKESAMSRETRNSIITCPTSPARGHERTDHEEAAHQRRLAARTEMLEKLETARRYMGKSIEPATVYAIQRHRTRTGHTVYTLKILFGYAFEGRPHLGQYAIGRAFAHYTGNRWDSANLGWTLEPGVALPELKPDLRRIFEQDIEIISL